MAKQSFTAEQREALWNAHNRKCAYTSELIEVRAFHIDHIIPEKDFLNRSKFHTVKHQLNLPNDFDPNGYENLLPCTPQANLKKSGDAFDEASMRFFLNLAAKKKQKVIDHIETIKQLRKKNKAIILLQQYLENGDLNHSEVASILEQYEEQPKEIFQLLEKIEFADTTEIQTIAKDDIETLYDRPIRFGKNDHIDHLVLTNDDGEKITVRTCREFDNADTRGYYALTTFDMKMASYFVHQCGLLNALKSATLPLKSFVSAPRVGVVDLNLLPVSLFPCLGDLPNFVMEGSYQDKITKGELQVKQSRNNFLQVDEIEGGMGQVLIEVARADFNGNGLEDILLFTYEYATHGTLGFGGIAILSRSGPNEMFEIIR